MSGGADLLRMLEPAVRPAKATPCAAAPRQPVAPIEARSFDSLLQEARQMNVDEADNIDAAGGAKAPVQAGPLGVLVGVDAIENDALRRLLAGAVKPT